ncbi:MAG TPA: hypothetical protein VF183_12000 [Acidimicrobiales bacterium]
MLGAKTFFSFTHVTDPALHRAYNEWHQLDHRPENLALPGVAWGERWVRSPDCAHVSARHGEGLDEVHYVNLYWFREPVAQSIAEWSALAERSFHWGRRDDIRLSARPLMGFFRPIKGYVNPRVLVSADVVPLRPNRGVYVLVTRVDEPRSSDAELLFRWYDRERIPAMLRCRGAVGAWSFASESTFETHLDLAGGEMPASTRIVVVWLDDDPLEFARELDALAAKQRVPDGLSEVETTMFAAPLRVIVPWEWDWFDEER